MNNASSSGGIGFVGLLTVAFVVLKLCGVIAWSWWWVLSPLWISVGLWLVVLLVGGLILLITAYVNDRREQKYRQERRLRR